MRPSKLLDYHQTGRGQFPAMHLKCTGEHLQAHSEGGKADRTNIVAACAYCNRLRHQRKEPPTPECYKALVNRRLSQGKWHGLRL
ncbi:HNH endonuclease [Methylomonas koyamae]|uniref:HNH endonuclease n=1 Tax=Methylomonas koyamae TaxID=702114 RepID=UPI0009EE219A